MSQLADFSKMDIPMFRDIYRQLRRNTIQMAGGTNADFDAAVKLELEFNDMNPTPQNYVVCAMDVEREEHIREMCESEAADEQAKEDQMQLAWEAACEARYDYMKENP